MKVKSAHVIIGRGPDLVSLITDLPVPIGWKQHSANTAHLKFEATAGAGVDYVRQHFPGVPIESLNLNNSVLIKIDADGVVLEAKKVVHD
jgi:hypothetical protein